MNMRFVAASGWVLVLVLSGLGGVGAARAAAPVARQQAEAPNAPLAGLAGHWVVRQSMWLDAGSAPVVDHGTADLKMVLGGSHLRQDLRIASSKPFEGLGYIGYDDATGKYDSSWMDTNFAGMIVAHGDFDAASRTYTFTGAMAGKDGTPIPVREVMRVDDDDHFVYQYYETRHGKEALAVSLEYTRVD